MARRHSSAGPSLLVALLVIGVLAAAGWYLLRRQHPLPGANLPAPAPVSVSAERIDPANEGRRVVVSGVLRVASPARDTQLGIEAGAVALLREVEMLQWREHCVGAKCDYALAWSPEPVDSHAFREARGRANTTPFPFTGARFLSGDVRLGAFKVDAALAADGAPTVAYPVHVAQLPPNLAATFRERDGVLHAGADAQHAAAGDLRVRYRIVAAGERRLDGVQAGDRLRAASTH
jgi:hypothetical protein